MNAAPIGDKHSYGGHAVPSTASPVLSAKQRPVTVALIRFYSWRRLCAVLVAFGALLRIIQYAANRSLWLDEAAFARNVLDRSFAQLLLPLDYLQTPPMGFLLFEKLAVSMLGGSEYALRLLPFLAGIVSLFLACAVARRAIGSKAAVIFLALFAGASHLVYFSAEAKQYSLDVAISLMLTLLALYIASPTAKERLTIRRAAIFSIAGVVAPWLSLPSVFVIAGVVGVLEYGYIRKRDWSSAFRLLAATVLSGPSIVVARSMAGKNITDVEQMRAYWSSGFMPFPPRSLDDTIWLGRAIWRTFRDPLDFPLPALGLVAFLAGLWWMIHVRRQTAFLLLAPILVALGASALKNYPFGSEHELTGRVLLFLVPTLLIFVAEGAEQIRKRAKRGLRIVGMSFVLLLVLPVVFRAVLSIPFRREEIRPVIQYLLEHRAAGDSIYVHFGATHAWRYYAQRMSMDPATYRIGICARYEPERYSRDLAPLIGHDRVWVVHSNSLGTARLNEVTFLIAYLDGLGKRLETYVNYGAGAYLYDLRKGVTPTSPVRRTLAGPVFRKPRTAALDCRGPYAPG